MLGPILTPEDTQTLIQFINKYQKARKFRAYVNGAQTITQALLTKIKFDTITFDNQNCFNSANNRFIAREDGFYLVTSLITYNGGDAGSQVQSYIYKNGSSVSNVAISQPTAGNVLGILIVDIIQLKKNDYIEIWTYHNSAAGKPLLTGSAYNYLSISRI